MSYVVELNWYEQIIAKVTGSLRMIESDRKNCQNRIGDPDERNLKRDVDAAGGEEAVAKFLGRYWCGGVNNFDGADVFPNIEVRTTDYLTGRLIVRAKDPDDRKVVMVRGSLPTYEIVGWILAADAKKNPTWKANPNGDGECWMVPASALCTEFKRKETNGLSSVPPTDPR